MGKDKRQGYVTLSIEMPIEVADWLAANAERLGNELRIASVSARQTEEQTLKHDQDRAKDRRDYLIDLGRTGYRELRRAGVTKSLAQNRDTIRDVAEQFGVAWQPLEIAVTHLDGRIRERQLKEQSEHIISWFLVRPNWRRITAAATSSRCGGKTINFIFFIIAK